MTNSLLTVIFVFLTFCGAMAQDVNQIKNYPDFSLGGQVQIQLDDGGLGARRVDSDGAVRNGIGVFPVDTHLSPRRLRLYPRVDFTKDLSLINETDFEPDEFEEVAPKLTVLDLYLKYDFAKDHHLRIGQAKVPFGYEFFRTSRELTTIERSDASRQWFQRDIGLGVFGKEGGFEYGAGMYQGQGENNRERNGAIDVAGRMTYHLTSSFQLGVSGHWGSFRPEFEAQDIPVRRLDIEAHFEDGPFALDAEYLIGSGYNLFSQIDSRSRGYYAYGTYRAQDDLDLVVGYDRFDPDLDIANPIRSANATNDRDRFTMGLNYYISRKPVHRMMLNYEFRRELEGPSISTKGFRLRYQYSW